ncbi:hypothetical protein QR680_010168 [Steinernema hermaphroditum]|uniref:Carboxylic ester hydrolase n=1 Tax=Steinernema hermaphroditum TaxID=289476 RepID=A0AA39MA70_9BILA|nr:hypothetical protein QR680_010168 [Steinernema hermaphroditum]
MIFRLLSVAALLATALAFDPLVQTRYGYLQGFSYNMSNGREANIYLGVPYAAAPVGSLRFEKPVNPSPWKGVREAKEFGAPCFQHTAEHILTGPGEFSEDCLTMNIFNVSDNFVSQGIIVITINYRLSAFGFFSTGDGVVSGNLGYFDQAAALRFIVQTVASFGGNPRDITVTGESAGGSSVSALTLSPHTNRLFQKAIAMSGSQYNPFSNYAGVINSSYELAAALGCSGSSWSIKSCMKTKSAKKIRDGIAKIGQSRDQFVVTIFNPYFDGDFFPYPIDVLARIAPKIPMITGVIDYDGAFFTLFPMPALFQSNVPFSEMGTYSAQNLTDFIVEKTIADKSYGKQIGALTLKMVDYYVNRALNGRTNLNSSDYVARYSDLFTDVYFNVPMFWEVQDKAASGSRVYIYREEYHNPAISAAFPVKGAYHGNEIPALFGVYFTPPYPFDDNDRAFQKDILSGFISFIKYGKPVVSGKKWDHVTKENSGRYMSFSPNSQMEDSFVKSAIEFWMQDVCADVNIKMLRESILPAARRPRK